MPNPELSGAKEVVVIKAVPVLPSWGSQSSGGDQSPDSETQLVQAWDRGSQTVKEGFLQEGTSEICRTKIHQLTKEGRDLCVDCKERD